MKYLFLISMLVYTTLPASAQKHKLFADAGISGSQLLPGLSVTYNYNPLPFLGIGAGAHVHHFFPTIADKPRYVPALFGDARFTIFPGKKNQVLAFLNIGANFYQNANRYHHENTIIYTDQSTSGIHTGIGIGYLRVLTENGRGIYWTLKTLSNNYSADAFDLATKQSGTITSSRGTIILSFGVRF